MTRNLVIQVLGNSYTVKYPTVGQILDLESAKASLSKGQYGAMIDAQTLSSLNALGCIDIIAHFQILIPELILDLKVSRIQDLDPSDFMELVRVYKNDLMPWVKEWQDEFKKSFAEAQSENIKQ